MVLSIKNGFPFSREAKKREAKKREAKKNKVASPDIALIDAKLYFSGPGCSKLTKSLVNVSLKFQM